MKSCPDCGAKLQWDELNELWFCPNCEYWDLDLDKEETDGKV